MPSEPLAATIQADLEMARIVMDDAPTIMLIQPKSHVGINPAIKGYAIHPISFVAIANLSR